MFLQETSLKKNPKTRRVIIPIYLLTFRCTWVLFSTFFPLLQTLEVDLFLTLFLTCGLHYLQLKGSVIAFL